MRTRWPALITLLVAATASAKPPKLTLFIAVDSLSSDLLLRSSPRLKNGLGQLLSKGAYYPTARYEFAATSTAPGHATLSTGANPWRHGIVSNSFLNRATGKLESAYVDPKHPALEVPITAEDTSPVNLLAEALADRLVQATRGQGKAIAVSGKARSAISLAGHMGTAYWLHPAVGKFVTGTHYAKEFPAWVKTFNEKKLPDSYLGKEWTLLAPVKDYAGVDDRPFEADALGLGRAFPHPLTGGLSAPGPHYYYALTLSPMADELVVQFAKAALESEQLGKDDHPDLLAVSLSGLDGVYHLFGPYSWETQDAMLRLDKTIGELVAAAERAAGGRANLLIVLSADHGGVAIPEELTAMGMPGARLQPEVLKAGLNKELQTRFNAANLVSEVHTVSVYLNTKVLTEKRIDAASVRRAVVSWLNRQPNVLFAVTRDDLFGDDRGPGYLKSLQLNYHPDRSGDVLFIVRPFTVLESHTTGTSHGTPYAYDAQVPVVFAGKGVKAGLYREEIRVTDIAPTAAALLEMGPPAQAEGAVRVEVLSAR